MTVEDANMLTGLHLRRIHEAAMLARTSKNTEDSYDRVYFEGLAQEKFKTYKAMLENTIARYLEAVSKEVGLSPAPDVPG